MVRDDDKEEIHDDDGNIHVEEMQSQHDENDFVVVAGQQLRQNDNPNPNGPPQPQQVRFEEALLYDNNYTYNDSQEQDHEHQQLQQTINDERLDTHATIEHLIITGNYYRHQQWRMKQWQLEQQSNVPPTEYTYVAFDDDTISTTTANTGNMEIASIDNGSEVNSDKVRRRKRPRQSVDDSIIDADGKSKSNSSKSVKGKISDKNDGVTRQSLKQVFHAQDARIYSNQAMEPDPWPKALQAAAMVMSVTDHRWVEELSDPHMDNPIIFSKLRLSRLMQTDHSIDISNVNEPYETEPSFGNNDQQLRNNLFSSHLFHDDSNENINNETAARTLLLRCWERAIHAASTTLEVDPTVLSPSPTPNTLRNISCNRFEAIRLCRLYDIFEEKKRNVNYSNSTSEDFANNDHIDNITLGGDVHVCSVCERQFDTKELLQDHFYGTNPIDGVTGSNGDCCWHLVDQKRRTITASLLELEVTSQIDQLLRLILQLDPTSSTEATPSSTLIDGFEVLRMMNQYFEKGKNIRKSDRNSNHNGIDVVQKTLEFSLKEPPLPINAAILQAVRYRLVDRYGMIPR